MAVRKRRAPDEPSEARDNVIEAPIPPRRISVSDSLRSRRLECGLEIVHVAQVLRIKPAVLVAIEDGNFDQLPGPTYAVGFVRSYATYLGLDAEALVQRFKAEATEVQHRPHLEFPLPIRDSRMPTGPLLVICLALAAVTYGAWYYFSAPPGRLADIVPEVPDRLHRLLDASSSPKPMVAAQPPASTAQPAPVAPIGPVQAPATSPATGTAPAAGVPGTTAQAPGAPAEIAGVPSQAPPTPTTPAPTTPASTTSGTAGNPPVPATDGVPPVDHPANQAEPTIAAQQPELAQPPVAGEVTSTPAATIYGASGGQSRVVLHATADSWIQVRDKGGNLLFTRVLKPGETYNVPNEDGLTMVTGNAGGIDITVDGAGVPKLGELGKVVRNVSLNPDHLLAAQTHAN